MNRVYIYQFCRNYQCTGSAKEQIMMTKIFYDEAAEKAKFTGLLDYKSVYFVLLQVKS